MANQKLVTILQNVTLAGGASTTIPHGLKSNGKGITPTQVICDRASPIAITGIDTLGVTFTNMSAGFAVANFRVECDHSIHTARVVPVAWQGWDGTAAPVGPAGGDLRLDYPDPIVVGLNGYPLDLTPPVAGDYARFDGTTWRHTLVAPGAQTAIYGCFSDTTDQPLNGGVTVVKFNTVEAANGVTVANDPITGHPTRLTVTESGVYAINLSPQLAHSGGGNETISFWPRIDGINVPNSASSLEMGNNNNRTLPFFEQTLPLNAGQYIEWLFYAIPGTAVTLEHYPLAAPVPANPSVVANIKRIGSLP